MTDEPDGTEQVRELASDAAAGVERADDEVGERDQPDDAQRQPVGAGLRRAESLPGQVVVDRRNA